MHGSGGVRPAARMPLRHPVALGFALCALALGAPGPAHATSKTKLVAIGDQAPGGGIFAGPSFTGWPSAAGNPATKVWVAFRAHVTQGKTTEAITAVGVTGSNIVATIQVASIGQAAPDSGTFRQFIGRPTINARGDVAFAALLNDAKQPDDPTQATPAGVFLYDAGTAKLTTIARSRAQTAAGTLDLAAQLDPSQDPSAVDVPQRTVGLDDAGDVAFVSGITGGGAAIFFACAGSSPASVVRVGDAFDGGKFAYLGPPALNSQKLVFHGALSTTSGSDDDGRRQGIFVLVTATVDPTAGRVCSPATAPTALVDEASGIAPMPVGVPLTDIEDPLAINENGDVAFLGGPAYDPDPTKPITGDGAIAVLVVSHGMTEYVAWPGLKVGTGIYSDSTLPSIAGSDPAAPGITADGNAVYYASLNSGSSGALVRADDPDHPLVTFGGASPDVLLNLGQYSAIESAPAVDATGGPVFLTRLAGATAASVSTTEAVVYRPATAAAADAVLIARIGDSTADAGLFVGPPFGPPALNDTGDVVFRAFVARSSSSVGIFRSRAGRIESVVRAGDPAPGGGTFFDIQGRPSVNNAGTVAFAASVLGKGTGVFVIGANGAKTIALRGDDGPPGTTFAAVGINPAINDAGVVAFRATVTGQDGHKQEGVYVAGAFGVRPVALVGAAPTGGGDPFFKFRDPSITNTPVVGFNASLGTSAVAANGLFVADLNRASRIAVEGQALGDGVTLSGVTGAPAVDDAGNVAFLGRRSAPPNPGSTLRHDLGLAVMTQTRTGIAVLEAQDMPGPAGGSFKSFGAPALGGNGDVLFFGSFNPKNPAAAGFFLSQNGATAPYLLVGETSPIGTRFVSLGTRAVMNAHDELAFIGTVSKGDARNAIFLASPTRLAANLGVGLSGGRGHDRIRLRATMRLGRTNDGVDPAHEPVVVSLIDATGRTVWAPTLASGALKRRGKRFLPDTAGGHPLPKGLRALRVGVNQETVRVVAQSPVIDLSSAGTTPVQAPFTLIVQVGDDSGTAHVTCRFGRRGGRCSG